MKRSCCVGFLLVALSVTALASTTARIERIDAQGWIWLEILTTNVPGIQTRSYSYRTELPGVEALGSDWKTNSFVLDFQRMLLVGRMVELELDEPALRAQTLHLVSIAFTEEVCPAPAQCTQILECPTTYLLRYGVLVAKGHDFSQEYYSWMKHEPDEAVARDTQSGIWRDYRQSPLTIRDVDPEGEYILLWNVGPTAVSLAGWFIADGEGVYTFGADESIEVKAPFPIGRADYNPNDSTQALQLADDADRVFLCSPEGYIIDYFEWGMPWQ